MFITVNAGPGSGKSHSLTMSYLLLSGRTKVPSFASDEQRAIYDFILSEFPKSTKVAFFSHTNTVKDHLSNSLPKSVAVKTFHGHGQSQLIRRYGYQALTRTRTDEFISDITGKHLQDLSSREKWQWITVKRLVSYLKQEYLDPTEENLEYCLMKYSEFSSSNLPSDWKGKAAELMRLSLSNNHKVEFGDMTWMAAKKLKKPVYDIGFVDEHQDMGGATFELVRQMCKDVVFCGDPHQAINAFAGADEKMFKKVEAYSDAVFPLKTTFRCPVNIIDRANDIYPGSVAPGPNKEIGEDRSLTYSKFFSHLPEKDPEKVLVLSRTNAPLVSIGLKFRTKGVPVKLADKDLANKLISFVKGLHCRDIGNLSKRLEDYVQQQAKRKNQMARLNAEDNAACILELSVGCTSLKALYDKIKEVIDLPNKKEAYLLATIHKAKGLEAENVYILDPPIEHPLAMEHPIAKQQEHNLHFVAITRTKLNLYWVKP